MLGFNEDCGSWKTMPRAVFRNSCHCFSEYLRISTPSNHISPFVKRVLLLGRSPNKDKAVNDFPLPDSPTMAVILFLGSENESCLSNRFPSIVNDRFSTCTKSSPFSMIWSIQSDFHLIKVYCKNEEELVQW